MADEYLLRRIASGAVTEYKWRIKSLDGFTGNLDMPSEIIEMPEDKSSAAILTKLQGNRHEISFSFTLAPNIVTDITTPANDTVEELFDALISKFEAQGVDYKFEFRRVNAGTETATTPAYTKFGILTGITYERARGDNVNYNVTIRFREGDVITVVTS